MGFLSGLLGLDAGKATMKAANRNRAEIDALGNRGFGYLDAGEQRATGYLNDARSRYDPYAASGSAADAMQADALGLNGADGMARARAAFQAGPGYGFAVEEGMRGAERAASAGGMLASGNLLTELQSRGQNLANQEYSGWLGNLGNLANRGVTAASGQAGVLTNLANLAQEQTGQRLGWDSSIAAGRMGANNQYAQGKEANKGAWAGLGSTIGNMAGRIPFGM